MTIAAERYTSPARTAPANEPSPGAKISAQLNDLFITFKRLTSLQLSIWMKQVKSLVAKIVMVAILSVIALFFVLMGIIFLYAGVYHVLTDLLRIPTAWALLIFAGAHLLAAGILAAVAISLLHKREKPDKSEKP